MMKSRRSGYLVMAAACICAALISACGDDPATQPPAAPGVPVGTKITEHFDKPTTSVVIEWSAPADSAGITGYRVWWGRTADVFGKLTGYADSVSLPATARMYRIENLTPDTSYTIAVASYRGDVSSAKSAQTLKVSKPMPPAPPTDVIATYLKTREVFEVRWVPPSDSLRTGFAVSWKGAVSGDSGSVNAADTAKSITIPGLSCVSRYEFFVRSAHDTVLSQPAWFVWVPPPAPVAPKQIRTSIAKARSIRVQWVEPVDHDGNVYVVRWKPENGGAVDSVIVADSAYSITNLSPGVYTVDVGSMRGCLESTTIGTTVAVPMRYDVTYGLRMYEKASSKPGGLLLDPDRGGPKAVSVESDNPEMGTVQVVLVVDSPWPGVVEIGTGGMFDEYKSNDKFDRNVCVSDSSYAVPSLDEWIFNGSIAPHTTGFCYNSVASLSPQRSDGNGEGFFVRTGIEGNYHYARVFVRNVGGRLLQGTAPDRYVEIELAYQTKANVPYAKPAVGAVIPAANASQRRH